MIAKLLWIAALLATGVVAVFAQVDRQVRYQPELTPLVPRAFSGFAAAQRVRTDIGTENWDAAANSARDLLLRRPIPAENLTLFALAMARSGQDEAAIPALEASARRGWREPVAQLAAARAALASNDATAAARRVSALLAVGELRDDALDLLAGLLRSSEGREAFVSVLADRTGAQDYALTAMSARAAPRDTARTVTLALAEGVTFSCAQLRRVGQALKREGYGADRGRLWQDRCARRR
ncbi:hypothetical protein [Aurantiacibacter spongiae]|uniref:Tetratricopeptide repeat protein n=1 Tax=Aurantiacibacter spongiae TaxID=2488860 RepID=A0A3N5DA53_9SPHN|nr:hypothetical protein [Aurantiacibacter spongiae]RPF71538.1 hypothetical protein EG799_07845 [Aurantiacibacter spongiae]